MSLFRKFLRLRRSRGLSGALMRALRYLLPEYVLAVKRGVIMVNDLSALQRVSEKSANEFTWTSVKQAAHYITRSGNEDNIDAWSGSNYEMVVAQRDREWIGYEVYYLPRDRAQPFVLFQQDWLRADLADHQVWCPFTYVVPAYRRQRVAAEIISFASLRLGEQGYGQAFGCVETFNRTASQAHTKRGFRSISRFVFVRICGLKVVKCGARYRFGFWNAERPLVLVPDDVWPQS